MNTIITHSDKGVQLAEKITRTSFEARILRSPKNIEELWRNSSALIFIGALGICVREIAPFLEGKKNDPAVINIDVNGQFVQSVVSGHLGGANKLSNELSRILGATPVITTVSDTSELWPLDLLPERFGWALESSGNPTKHMANFINQKPTALLLEIRDRGTLYLESTLPEHVAVYYDANRINSDDYELILAVTPFLHEFGATALYFRPKAIHLGLGCQRNIDYQSSKRILKDELQKQSISPLSIASINSVELKKDESAFLQLSKDLAVPFNCYTAEVLTMYESPNPSAKVLEVAETASVAEAAAMHASGNQLLIKKTKLKANDKYFTLAATIDINMERNGHIEFVGAGPGDPELVSVKGKRWLQTADFILYAGSLVPKELTQYAKAGCLIKSSADMDLGEQIEAMAEFYNKGLLSVRLHTGDPCIYGAIQEQMAELDKRSMKYSITPGISSFQAAAAALKSQFTIPEEVQTIILTRGEGRTPMPEREQLDKLAASQSTMCIYLSASLADKIEQDLLVHYPPETPVAICYKLTWREEKIYRCSLNELAQTVKENKLKMTTLIVVGKAIDNRSGLSKLYHQGFSHTFRSSKKPLSS